MIRLIAFGFALFLVLPSTVQWPTDGLHPPAAFADDDDGDSDSDNDNDNDSDDDDNDSDEGGGQGAGHGGQGRSGSNATGSSGAGAGRMFAPIRRLFGGREQRPAAPRRPASPPVLFVSGEIIVLNISSTDLQSLLDEGYRVLEQRSAAGGQTYYRLAVPDGLALPDARDAVRALPSGQNTDFNHYYRPERGAAACQGETCPAFELVGWPGITRQTDLACSNVGAIGIIDTGINDRHPVFSGSDMTVLRLADETLPASKASHGTAVAALLVGQPETRVRGLLPDARLVAVDAFHRAGRDERADAFTLVEALYTLSAEDVTVVNLSLTGPENSVVRAAIQDLSNGEGIVFAAAAGNGGPAADPVYPAAYDEVLAVTAVDRNKRVYRRANRGDYVDLAAPGVNVWTAASVKGAKWRTGTSFAVPFVSGAAAIVRAKHPEKTPAEIHDILREAAADLGDPGHDPVYGHGLLQMEGLC
ncbi:MAG: S8 family serine peptidase [Pseudomonadota bacterium]